MPRAKKTVALEAVSKSGAAQPEIQVDKIHRFPVIVSSPSDQICGIHSGRDEHNQL